MKSFDCINLKKDKPRQAGLGARKLFFLLAFCGCNSLF
ncbi:hypothetical protein CAMGR0001_0756 [Campylobacter gracilis RM3268]|uniref:Uncharacterized protein n=1 Tax=Campylobacter gracilis RM3268 TaxID=553220 RepID=C8PFW5_9BACT|nr:hypothetical protein CAMGR0001_0756 [Campylobacter gracilis RM3268]